MREIRIFQQDAYFAGQKIKLSAKASIHVATVLRMRQGQELTLFDGSNNEAHVIILEASKKNVLVEVLAVFENINRESPRKIHLFQSVVKGERMEWIIQKAVELGVTEITPLITLRTVVKLDKERMQKKLEQWHAIAVSACEQCQRNVIPKINDIWAFDSAINAAMAEFKFILSLNSDKLLSDFSFDNTGNIILLTGPEGGFSSSEIAYAEEKGFNPLKLGPRVLRTETASIVALGLLQALSGDLSK